MGFETDTIANKTKTFPSFDAIMYLKTPGKPLRVCSKVVTTLKCIRKVPNSIRNID